MPHVHFDLSQNKVIRLKSNKQVKRECKYNEMHKTDEKVAKPQHESAKQQEEADDVKYNENGERIEREKEDNQTGKDDAESVVEKNIDHKTYSNTAKIRRHSDHESAPVEEVQSPTSPLIRSTDIAPSSNNKSKRETKQTTIPGSASKKRSNVHISKPNHKTSKQESSKQNVSSKTHRTHKELLDEFIEMHPASHGRSEKTSRSPTFVSESTKKKDSTNAHQRALRQAEEIRRLEAEEHPEAAAVQPRDESHGASAVTGGKIASRRAIEKRAARAEESPSRPQSASSAVESRPSSGLIMHQPRPCRPETKDQNCPYQEYFRMSPMMRAL